MTRHNNSKRTTKITTMSSTVQLRIDATIKRKAQKILKDMGLDLSAGSKLFLTQVVRKGSIPFEIRTVNGFTPAKEAELIRETEWAEKYGKGFKTADEFFKHLRS